MKKELYIEKLANHAPLALSIVLRSGRRPSAYTKHAVAEFMREHGIEELEAYYGQEAVEGAIKGTKAGQRDPAVEETEAGVSGQVGTQPVDGTDVGVQPSEAEVPPKPKGKRRGRKKKGKSLLDGEGA